ncbi:TetR/AcrR family transcriptional regulator [Actinokineospora soli]|uniref:TetR/AcrR family transcriptional regulator n=1 Tax=Actinokineospora soli TaxID=1048753 RepID=A0ABW2TV99_9PSEU
MASDARRYRGQDAAQRHADRRARLLEAGLELFGTAGYAAVTVKQICQAAGLTERYFYQSFTDREDLLTSVFTEQVEALKQATLTALATAEPTIESQAAAGIGTFVRFVAADHRRARVIFIEVVGISPTLEHRRRDVTRDFAGVIAALATHHLGVEGGPLLQVGTMFFAGGLAELIEDWLVDDHPADLDTLIYVVVILLTTAFDVLRAELNAPDVARKARITAGGLPTAAYDVSAEGAG